MEPMERFEKYEFLRIDQLGLCSNRQKAIYFMVWVFIRFCCDRTQTISVATEVVFREDFSKKVLFSSYFISFGAQSRSLYSGVFGARIPYRPLYVNARALSPLRSRFYGNDWGSWFGPRIPFVMGVIC